MEAGVARVVVTYDSALWGQSLLGKAESVVSRCVTFLYLLNLSVCWCHQVVLGCKRKMAERKQG